MNHTVFNNKTLFFQLVIVFVLLHFTFTSLFLLFIASFRVFLLKCARNWKEKSKNLENYLCFLEKLNLKLNNQQSFTQSLLQLERESDAFMQQNKVIYDTFVLFMTQKTRNLSKFQQTTVKHLDWMKNNPHQAKIYLKNLLYEEKQRQFFRHKSGQITYQTRAQMSVVVGMYLVMFFLQMKFFHQALVLKYFFYSLPLMMISLFVTKWIIKGFQWKV